MQPILAARTMLEQERTETVEFQARLAGVRGAVEAVDISSKELEALDAELEALMLSAIRESFPGLERNPDAAVEPATLLTIPVASQKFDL